MGDDWNPKRELGRVEAVKFGREDHGILTLFLMLDFGGSGQGFGGLALDDYDKARDRRCGTAMGLDFVLRLLDLFKVDTLERIVGRHVYTIREKPMGQILALEIPACDGGGEFAVETWRSEWAGDKRAERTGL